MKRELLNQKLLNRATIIVAVVAIAILFGCTKKVNILSDTSIESNRLEQRAKENGFSSYKEYARYLDSLAKEDK